MGAAKTIADLARRSKSALIGGSIVTAIVVLAVFAPLAAPHDPYEMNFSAAHQAPTATHVLGTDNYGRDLFSRLIFGARISLVVGICAVAVAVLVGVSLGLAAGYLGGTIDLTLMRLVDIWLAFPSVLLAIALVSFMGADIRSVIIAVGLVQWTAFARVVRASALELKESDYVLAARAAGVPDLRIALRHVLPGAVAPVLVLATLGVGGAITGEALLSFLGLGVRPPTPSWGATLAFGLLFLRSSPHLAIFPGLAIMITTLGFNLLGDGLRDLGDPRLRHR